MFTRVSVKRWAVLAIGAVLAGVLAGGVVAAQLGGVEDPERLVSAIENEPMVKVLEIAPEGSLPGRGVFVQTTSTGQFCLWDAPSAGGRARQGGCNSVEDPLGGRKLSASFSYQGGPAAAQASDARLIGLVSTEVASVQVVMSDGTRRDVRMKKAPAVATAASGFRVFGYRFKTSDLKRGVGPTAVVALDASGNEVERQETGFAE